MSEITARYPGAIMNTFGPPRLALAKGAGSIVWDEDGNEYLDLFAGIGGIRLGFESAGGECVFTSEWNEFSQKTYRENFGADHPLIGDIVPPDTSAATDVATSWDPAEHAAAGRIRRREP